MHDETSEKISALMDDEFHAEALKHLQQDAQARARWMRYHLIRDVVSGHTRTIPSTDFAQRVSQALADEPTLLAPRERKSRLAASYKHAAGLAIAATVAAVAILTVQPNSVQDNGLQPAQSGLLASANPPARLAAQPVSNGSLSGQRQTQPARVASSPMPAEAESRLSGYLVNHNEYSVTSRMQGMLPYMRIVSITPNERLVITISADEDQ